MYITSGEFRPFCGKRNTKVVQNLQTSQAYIFRILQYFATKLGNFTNFNMLFLAVVKDFDFFAKMKIQFKRGMVHCPGSVLVRFIKLSGQPQMYRQLCCTRGSK